MRTYIINQPGGRHTTVKAYAYHFGLKGELILVDSRGETIWIFQRSEWVNLVEQ